LSPSIRNNPNDAVERNSSVINPTIQTRCGALRATTSHSTQTVSRIGSPLMTGNGPIVWCEISIATTGDAIAVPSAAIRSHPLIRRLKLHQMRNTSMTSSRSAVCDMNR
jgi:hypothetical protein